MLYYNDFCHVTKIKPTEFQVEFVMGEFELIVRIIDLAGRVLWERGEGGG